MTVDNTIETHQAININHGIDGLSLAAITFIAFMALILFRELRSDPIHVEELAEAQASYPEDKQVQAAVVSDDILTPAPEIIDQSQISAPYDQYTLTQGPHGFSYGHMAIDIVAGKESVIKSPINGLVSAHYVDQYGNPTLVIENEVYQVTMLHGVYSVALDEKVTLGQPVGTESNQGYTTDWWGRSCRNRDCGYHTHLNIFDKRIRSNVNPLDLID